MQPCRWFITNRLTVEGRVLFNRSLIEGTQKSPTMASDLHGERPLLPSGVRIIENSLLTDGPFEDWAQVRSHGRAKRRRAKHKQRIRIYCTPSTKSYRLSDGSIVMHPEMARQLLAHLKSNGGE